MVVMVMVMAVLVLVVGTQRSSIVIWREGEEKEEEAEQHKR